jgi:hypothetical protein
VTTEHNFDVVQWHDCEPGLVSLDHIATEEDALKGVLKASLVAGLYPSASHVRRQEQHKTFTLAACEIFRIAPETVFPGWQKMVFC